LIPSTKLAQLPVKTLLSHSWLLALIFVANTSFGLQANFEPVANNTIYEDNPTYASGQSSNLFFGPIASGSPRRALLRFDVSSLPANAQITSATLTLTIDRAARNSDVADVISLHRLLASWGQGASNAGTGGGGTQASAGDSTWNARFYNAPPGVPSTLWNQPGGEFVASASTSQAMGITLGTMTLASTQALINDVQTWIGSPNENHGWIISAGEGMEYKARRFYGRNAFAPADRPKLTIAYEMLTDDTSIPFLSPCAMMILILGIIGIARTRHRT
jgi:hypothetical protein